ncbi:DUF4238 domain-containing protein [Roseovarius sp.]|uniref:DUF4238 domain-containing protein n=1 Tax=Roseovarius sp. TaxID=1486281 RepID=UPI003A97190D
MVKRSKAHHFVPKVLQKAFCCRGNEIWFSRKKTDRFTAPELTPTEKAFVVPNYYSILDGRGLSDVVEKEFYGKIDNYLGSMLPDVLSAFDRGEVPVFSGNALDSLRRIVFELVKRTPDFTKSYSDHKIGLEIAEATLLSVENGNKDSQYRCDILKILDDPEKLKAIGRSVRVKAVISSSDRIWPELEEFSVRWAISESKHSFILSSMIAYRVGNGGSNGLSNPNMEIWMPIAPKVALVLLRDRLGKVPLKVIESAEHIRKVNQYAIANSMQVGSHSQRLLESLTGQRSKFGMMLQNERREHS